MQSDFSGTFPSFDGVEIAFDRYGRTDAVPVILQHGFAADANSNWVLPGIVAAIRRTGRTVITLDARGHGRSGKPHDPASYGHTTMAQDVSALVDHLRLATFDFGGYSMGGHIGLFVLKSDPRVRTALIAGIGANALGGVVTTIVDRNVIADAFEAYIADPSVTIEDKTARQFVHFANASGADLRALVAHMRANNPPAGDMSSVRVPVLVVAGVLDDLAQTASELASKIPGARFVGTPGTHLSAVAEPAFIEAVAGFFRR